MFLSRRTVEPASEDEKEMKSSRSVVTKTVEKTGGVRTTTTTFNCCTRDEIEAALAQVDLDPQKFHQGGTTVTKTIVYTDSSGRREVLEETVENLGDPDQIARNGQSVKDSVLPSKALERGRLPQSREQPKLFPSMGSCCSKQDNCEAKNGSKSSPTADVGKAKNDSKSSPTADGKAKNDSRSSPKSDANASKFEQECLQAHNDYRKMHGVPPLQLSREMCTYAQEWADTLAKTDSFRHRTGDRKYGENIFMKWSSDPGFVLSGKEPVDSWYSEIKDHVFGREPTSLKSGHFTQVVWKGSKTLGVAQAKSKSGKILVVANYDPAGNFIGRFAENVPPPA